MINSVKKELEGKMENNGGEPLISKKDIGPVDVGLYEYHHPDFENIAVIEVIYSKDDGLVARFSGAFDYPFENLPVEAKFRKIR